jgi:hypothetical protein
MALSARNLRIAFTASITRLNSSALPWIAREAGQGAIASAVPSCRGKPLPERVGHERYDRLEQAQHLVERVNEHGARHLAVIARSGEPRLDRFEVPVGQFAPGKRARGLDVFVQSEDPQ